MFSRKALFLDRDGVININYGYVHDVNNFVFLDGIFELCRIAHEKNYIIVVITNQSGIARGFYSEEQFINLSQWMIDKFQENGVHISKVYFSPFHPTEGLGTYLKDDYSRKPKPGMIYRAKHELNIDLKNSLLIGDNPSDILAGYAAGIRLNLLLSTASAPELTGVEHVRINSLCEAHRYLHVS